MYTFFLSHTPEELEMLYSAGALKELEGLGKVIKNPYHRQLTNEELIELSHDANFIITTVRAEGSRELFERSPNLISFIRCGVDTRNINIDSASSNGILVCNCPGIYEAPVVELVIGFLCSISRGIPEHNQNLRQGIANRYTRPDLFGKTLGLIGYGSIARKVAITAKTLGMKIVVSDPMINEVGPDEKLVDLDELLSSSDFVSLHAVLNSETEGMIGERELELMKPTAWFINTGRGLLVQEDALFLALSNKKIMGAAVDVFATEPNIIGNPLLTLDNVIATPHIGGWSDRVYDEMSLKTVDIIKTIIKGDVPETTINIGSLDKNKLKTLP